MDQHVRVIIADGDEAQIAELGTDDYVEFEGSINGAPVAVRFYRAYADDRSGATLNGPASDAQQVRVTNSDLGAALDTTRVSSTGRRSRCEPPSPPEGRRAGAGLAHQRREQPGG